MDQEALRDTVVAMWRRNNEILLYLLAGIPQKGMSAVPSGSKGRDVSAQFHHLQNMDIVYIP